MLPRIDQFRLIANGDNLEYIVEQLGHSFITVTNDIYGHLIPGGNKQTVERLDETCERRQVERNRDLSRAVTFPVEANPSAWSRTPWHRRRCT